MDALERLTLEDAAAPSLLALTHVHRYQVAAEICAGMRVLDLCCGSGYGTQILGQTAASVTGVDLHAPSIERARATFNEVDSISFEVADALEYLQRDLAEHFDAIVLLEGLEHLPDAKKVIEMLRSHAEAGASMFISIPNEGSFPEDNRFHVTEFEYEDAIAICEGLDGARVLGQSHAEGSLIGDLDAVELGPVQAHLAMAERADAQNFNHYLVLANFGEAKISASSSMQLSVAPNFHRYMLELESENRTLWRTNQRLARARLGVADSAAAAALKRIDELDQPQPRVAREALKPIPSMTRLGGRVVLNLLPHAVTVVLMDLRARRRARLRRVEDRRLRLERSGLPPEGKK